MKVEQVDVGWRPDCLRGRAYPIKYQRSAARFCCAQNQLDFLVGRQNALLGLQGNGISLALDALAMGIVVCAFVAGTISFQI
jgi:hypothetical protein